MIYYADHAFYTDTYLAGKEAVVDTASFNFYVRQATQVIKQNTFNRIDESNIPEEVKMCCCELTELAYKMAITGNVKVSSEKVGSYSVEYKTAEQIAKEYVDKQAESLYNWLGMTGLLYRGRC